MTRVICAADGSFMVNQSADRTDGGDGANSSGDHSKRPGKQIKNRRMVTSARRTLIVAAKVLLLFAGASAYFAASFALEEQEFSRQYRSMAEQAYTARRNTLLRDAGATVREFLFASARSYLYRPLDFGVAAGTHIVTRSTVLVTCVLADYMNLMLVVDSTNQRFSRLELFQEGLLFGDPSLTLSGSMKRSEQLDSLNFGNACAMISSQIAAAQNYRTMPQQDCSQVGKGVLLSGLNAGIQLFQQLALSINTKTAATNGASNVTATLERMAQPEYRTFRELLTWWLPAGTDIETQLYLQEQVSHLDSFISLRTTIMAVFLCALFLCFFVVFEPMVYQMDTHVKRVRALLVMIPIEIVMSTASLRNALLSAV